MRQRWIFIAHQALSIHGLSTYCYSIPCFRAKAPCSKLLKMTLDIILMYFLLFKDNQVIQIELYPYIFTYGMVVV